MQAQNTVPAWFAELDRANAEIIARLEVDARRENEDRDIRESLANSDAYWKRVGGRGPSLPAIVDSAGVYS